jgi:hypothetical protein
VSLVLASMCNGMPADPPSSRAACACRPRCQSMRHACRITAIRCSWGALLVTRTSHDATCAGRCRIGGSPLLQQCMHSRCRLGGSPRWQFAATAISGSWLALHTKVTHCCNWQRWLAPRPLSWRWLAPHHLANMLHALHVATRATLQQCGGNERMGASHPVRMGASHPVRMGASHPVRPAPGAGRRPVRAAQVFEPHRQEAQRSDACVAYRLPRPTVHCSHARCVARKEKAGHAKRQWAPRGGVEVIVPCTRKQPS